MTVSPKTLLLSSEMLLIVGSSGTSGSPKKCRGPAPRCSSSSQNYLRCVSDRRSLASIALSTVCWACPSLQRRSGSSVELSLACVGLLTCGG